MTKYFDVHVFITRGSGYSIGVEMETPNNKKDYPDDDEVIEFARANNKFTERGDENYVDYVEQIDEEQYKQMTI